MRFISNRRGFTLIELLVVISIISLLSSVVLASVRDARDKAQGSQYIQGALQLQNALELYKADYGKYPNEGAIITSGSYGNFYTKDGLESALASKYIPTIPNVGDTQENYPDLLVYSTGIYQDSLYDLWKLEQGNEGEGWVALACGGKIPTAYIVAFYSKVELNFNKVGWIESYLNQETLTEGSQASGNPWGGLGYDSFENWYCVSM